MSNLNMYCQDCQCKCLILPWKYLYDTDRRLKSIGIEDRPELVNMVNSFFLIGTDEENGVLGQSCFDQLCDNIKESQDKANEYNEANIEDETTPVKDEERNFLYYLEDKWDALLSNMHFQNTYAAYLMYYYYITGQAASRSTKDGDVQSSRGRSANNTTATQNIEIAEAKRLAATQLNIAKSFTAILKRELFSKNPELYCQETSCGCGKQSCISCTGLKAEPVRRRPKTVAL